MRGQGRWGGERGVSAVTVALVLMIVGGFLALVLNVGHLLLVRGQLQNACDAAALAAARELDGTLDGIARARGLAVDFAARHATDRSTTIQIDADADVIFGKWDFSAPRAEAFTPIPVTGEGAARKINAVQVMAGRTQARGNPLEVFFSVFANDQQQAGIAADAIACNGAPCSACSIPLVLADCQVLKADGSIDCGQQLVLSSDTVDNAGFTNLQDGVRSVSNSGIVEILSQDCRGVWVGDEIGVQNGNDLNNHVADAFNDYRARNGDRVTVPIVTPPTGCPAKFDGLLPVVGFATFTLLDVTGPPHPAITIELQCGQTDSTPEPVGCDDFGTKSPTVALVR